MVNLGLTKLKRQLVTRFYYKDKDKNSKVKSIYKIIIRRQT